MQLQKAIIESIRSLSVGTIAQNIGIYSIVFILLYIIIVQHKVIEERKH
jgi:hypothetical protein